MPAPIPPAQRRKLIEVSLPLQKINEESAREKSIRHGHPSTLHLWWARRPLAAARAVLFAQLVDDPSCDPRAFEIEDDAEREAWIVTERVRLHQLIKRMVVWENSTDEALFKEAHAEILRCTDGTPPPILDPFAGGGSIPLEAQRLGLEAHASDLNPVAVLINKALIEIPPKFAELPPVFPGAADTRLTWPRATGLAEDIRRYGEWMRDEAKERIGHLYPDATLPDGTTAPVIAWIWARTVTCQNPACNMQMPLVKSWWLGKKPGKEAYVVPIVHEKGIRFEVGHDPRHAPTVQGTIGRTGAVCIRCRSTMSLKDIRTESRAHRVGVQLMATVAEGRARRHYLSPSSSHEQAARVPRPLDSPDGPLPQQALSFRVQAYGYKLYTDLFTPRQLTALTTLGQLVPEVQGRVLADAVAAGLVRGDRLEAGGAEASAYADAVATYLGMAVSKLADRHSTVTNWYVSRESTSSTFARQAIPITWDFAETHPLGTNTGSFFNAFDWTAETVGELWGLGSGVTTQADARDAVDRPALISTDPPYYDNIGYADLSDYFYVWTRQALRDIHPQLLATVLTPKAGELVANPYRHDGPAKARCYFEAGFEEIFAKARHHASADFPIAVYYAFKQAESDEIGEASVGWETLLGALLRGGWAITGTWPLRSEASNRMVGRGTNALASSVVLALRPRPVDAPSTDRRGFLAALRAELPEALRELQQGAIAPVDLPQAAIGPGMAVFTRYAAVLDNDGSPMSVRAALAQINQMLDEVLTEQENDFDADTRFAVQWFRQYGFGPGQYGDADNLARARGASVAALARSGILTAHAGLVQLLGLDALSDGYDPATDTHITVWEVVLHLTRRLASDGIPAAAALMARVPVSVDLAVAKELVYLLFAVAEERGQTADAVALNTLAAAWNEIASASHSYAPPPTQLGFDDDALL